MSFKYKIKIFELYEPLDTTNSNKRESFIGMKPTNSSYLTVLSQTDFFKGVKSSKCFCTVVVTVHCLTACYHCHSWLA